MGMANKVSILIVEDDREYADLIGLMLQADRTLIIQCCLAFSLAQGVSLLNSRPMDMVLLDLGLPDSSGLDTLLSIRDALPDIPVVVLTGDENEETGLESLRLGAIDYLVKGDLRGGYLRKAVKYALERHRLLRQLQDQHSLLEEAVQQRTKTLRDTVARLKVEAEEREKAEKAHLDALHKAKGKELEVTSLLQGAKAILQHRKFEESARVVFDICKKLVGASAGYVALLSPDGSENELLFLEAGGRPCSVNPELPMPIRGLRAEAYKTGKCVYDNDFMNSRWMEFMPGGHVALDNVLFAPLNLESRTEGIMGLANKPGGFTEQDAALATAMAEIASIGLSNSRTLESLHASQHRFHELFNRMGSGAVIYEVRNQGRDFYVKEMNETARQSMAVGESDYRDQRAEELFPGIKYNGTLEMLVEVWQSGRRAHHPPTLYEDESISKWFESYFFKLPGGELVEVFDDVTQRKMIEESLRKSEERYRSLIHSCPDPVVVYDGKGKVMSANPAFESRFGWKLAEIEGKFLEFVPQDEMGVTKRMVGKMVAGDKIVNFETRRMTAQGEILEVDISATKYTNDQNELVGYVVFLRDISDRKKLERQLRQNEQNLRMILESLPAGIVVVDARTHLIEYVNPVAAGLIGLPSEQIKGKECHSFICPAEKGKCPVTDLDKTIENQERILLTSSGKDIPILKTVVSVELGSSEYILESFIDISDLKKKQEEEMARKALQATMETAGAACHELNQPLQAIMNLADAALEDLPPDSPVVNDLNQILANSNKMAAITQKLNNLTSYQTLEYSDTARILDIYNSSSGPD